MSKRRIFFIFFLCFFVFSVTGAEKGYKIVTENYPPYNCKKDGKVGGFCTKVLREIMKRLKVDYPIELTDWNNAYHMALNEKNYIVYSMNRTKAREPLFKWVGPLVVNRWAFLSRADKMIVLKNLDDARKYKVGTYYNDVCEEFLNNNKFDKTECTEEDYQNVKKLVDGKIDLWLVADLRTAELFAKQAKVDVTKIKPVCFVQDTNLYIGFNRNAPDEIVNKFQTTLEQLKKDGTYQKIYVETFPHKSIFPTNLNYISLTKKKEVTVVKTTTDAGKATTEKAGAEQPTTITSVTTQETVTVVTHKRNTTQLSIMIPSQQWEQLHLLAKEKNMKIDDICRKAFGSYLREDKKAKRKRKRVLEKYAKPDKKDQGAGKNAEKQ